MEWADIILHTTMNQKHSRAVIGWKMAAPLRGSSTAEHTAAVTMMTQMATTINALLSCKASDMQKTRLLQVRTPTIDAVSRWSIGRRLLSTPVFKKRLEQMSMVPLWTNACRTSMRDMQNTNGHADDTKPSARSCTAVADSAFARRAMSWAWKRQEEAASRTKNMSVGSIVIVIVSDREEDGKPTLLNNRREAPKTKAK